MATPEMIAAVSAAVKGEAAPEAEAPETPETPETPESPESPEAPETPETPESPEAPETPEEPEQPEAAAGPERGPDGKFKAKAPKEGEEPAGKEPKAAAVEQPEAPEPDHVNDPIPENLKAATRERITSLVESVKTARAEQETVQRDFDALMAPIQEAGASFEQFQEAMTLVRLLNSPHQHDQMQALQYLQGAGSELATRLGQVAPGADPLAGFDDLQQAVQQNKMPRQYAEEVARARRQSAASEQFQRSSQQRSQQEQTRRRDVEAGQAAVRSVEQTLEANDPQYKAKIAIMRADQAFMAKFQKLPPAQWAPAFAEQYRSVKAPASAAAPAARAKAPAPLRAKSPAGTAAKPPSSMLEAVKGALGERRAG